MFLFLRKLSRWRNPLYVVGRLQIPMFQNWTEEFPFHSPWTMHVSSFLTTVTKHLAGRMEGEKELFGLTLSIIGGKIQCWERPYLCHGEQVVLGNREQRWEAKTDLIIRAPQPGTNLLQVVPMSQRSHISQSTTTSWDQVLNYRSLWLFYVWT